MTMQMWVLEGANGVERSSHPSSCLSDVDVPDMDALLTIVRTYIILMLLIAARSRSFC